MDLIPSWESPRVRETQRLDGWREAVKVGQREPRAAVSRSHWLSSLRKTSFHGSRYHAFRSWPPECLSDVSRSGSGWRERVIAARISWSKKCDVTYRCLEIWGATTPMLLGFKYCQTVVEWSKIINSWSLCFFWFFYCYWLLLSRTAIFLLFPTTSVSIIQNKHNYIVKSEPPDQKVSWFYSCACQVSFRKKTKNEKINSILPVMWLDQLLSCGSLLQTFTWPSPDEVCRRVFTGTCPRGHGYLKTLSSVP